MRILQLHAGYRTPAGEDTVVAAEATALRSAGHDVVQFLEHNPPDTVDALRALSKSRYNRDTARRVAVTCGTEQPDVAHVHNTWFALSASVIDAVADAGVPLVATVHTNRLGCLGVDLFREGEVCTRCVGRSPLAGVIHACYRDSRALSAIAAVEVMSTRRRGILERIDRFIVPASFMADRLVDIGLPSDRLVVKPHFTDDPGPRPSAPSTSDDVLFIGRLADAKGIATLLRAWERHADAHRRRTGRSPRLTVIGDGPMSAEARESAPRSVDFIGWRGRHEVTERMLSARAFVFPSQWYEPFGMVLIEAMAAGLPIVVTTASDAPFITGAPPTLVAPAGDAHALAACLDDLTDDTFTDETGAASRQRFCDHYGVETGIDRLVQIYRVVVDPGDAGARP